jgi:hypothetical protein
MAARSAVGGARPFVMRRGISTLSDLADGATAALAAAGAKTVYFVDNNSGSDSADGLSWASAFKTLAKALAISHADIASNSAGWASRNVVYYKADAETANLVLLADKTDVIGVGSYDARSMPGIIGNHVPVGSFMGTRFFNVCFRSPAAGGDIWTVPTTVSGLSFIGCEFDGASSTKATGAIVITTSERFTVRDCVFHGAYSDAVIEFAGTEFNEVMIANNFISGANQGIDVVSTVTTSLKAGWIVGNFISTTTEGINEASGKLYVHNNRVVTLAAKGTAGAGGIVAGAKMMLDNRVSASDLANGVVPAQGTL